MPVVLAVPAAIGTVMEALVWVLLFFALFNALVVIFRWVFQVVPVIGPQIVNALESAQSWVNQRIFDWGKSALDGLIAVVSAPVHWVQQIIAGLVTAAELTVAQLVGVIQRAVQLANQIALATANIAAELGHLASRVTAVAASIAGIAGKVASAAVAVLQARVIGWVDGLRLAIAQAIDKAHVELGHAIDGVNLRIHALELGLTHAIDVAITGVQTWVNQRVGPLEKDIADLGSVVDALPAVAEIVGTIEAVRVIEQIVEDCVKPTCSGLGPSLDILNALADGTALAAMLALVAQARTDPNAAASEVIGVTNGVAGTVRGILAPALG